MNVSNGRSILRILLFLCALCLCISSFAQEDVRKAFYAELNKQLFPQRGGSEFLVLLNFAVPVEPTDEHTADLLARLSDAAVRGVFLEPRPESIRELLVRNIGNIRFSPRESRL